MKQIEIKTDEQQQELAKEILEVLADAVNFSGDTTVTMGDSCDDDIKIIVNENTQSGIMTSAVLNSCITVLEWYKVRYLHSISYYIDITEDKRHPMLVVYVSKWSEK